jgi:hypothetical protein
MARTIQELAQEAVFVQNACNFIAVVNGMQRAMADLRAHGITGDALTNHPIALLWVDKLTSLQGVQDVGNSKMFKAHLTVGDFVDGKIDTLAEI